MIPGATAAQMLLHGAVGQPPVAVGFADFVAGSYEYDGTPYTAADVVDEPARITASGLSISNSGPVDLLGVFRDHLLAAAGGWTAVFEVDAVSPGTGQIFYLVRVWEAGLGHQISLYMEELVPKVFEDSSASGSYETRELADPAHPGAAGINRVALTRTEDRLSLSINGNEPVTLSAALQAATFATAEVGQNGGGTPNPAGHLRPIELYAAQPDFELAGLSAL